MWTLEQSHQHVLDEQIYAIFAVMVMLYFSLTADVWTPS